MGAKKLQRVEITDAGLAALSAERDIQQAILLELGKRPNVRLWRNNAGAAKSKGGRLVRFGIPGQGDLSGLLRLHCGLGVRLEVEVKSADGVQSKKQRAFQRMIQRFGGCYVLARSVGDAVAAVDAFLQAHRAEHVDAVVAARGARL